jgi:hypothetical protein
VVDTSDVPLPSSSSSSSSASSSSSSPLQHPAALWRLRVFKRKQREGVVDRVVDERTVIGNRLFNSDADMNQFAGLKVELAGRQGRIEGAFGKGGKFKAYFPDGLPNLDDNADPSSAATPAPAQAQAQAKGKGKGTRPAAKILLKYKNYIFAHDRKKFDQS